MIKFTYYSNSFKLHLLTKGIGECIMLLKSIRLKVFIPMKGKGCRLL